MLGRVEKLVDAPRVVELYWQLWCRAPGGL